MHLSVLINFSNLCQDGNVLFLMYFLSIPYVCLSPSDGGFWVGKDSLRQWKRMAVEKVESQFDEGEEGEGERAEKDGEEDMDTEEDKTLPNGDSSINGV